MKNLKKVALALTLAAPLVAGTAIANSHGGGGDGWHGKHMQKVYKELNLTEEQQAEIKTIRQKQREQMQQFRTEGNRDAQRAQMQALMKAETFDEDAARAMLNARHEASMEKKIAMMKSQHEIYQVLTPEQQAKFAEMMENAHGKRGKGKTKSE